MSTTNVHQLVGNVSRCRYKIFSRCPFLQTWKFASKIRGQTAACSDKNIPNVAIF